MAKKVFNTYRQQIIKLRKRGMIIKKGSQYTKAYKILEQENYYNVINGYKALFLEREATEEVEEKYKDGTTFDEVYALFCFDRDLRILYLKFLLKLENSFKTVIAHEFSSIYGYDNYLKLSNFQISSEKDSDTNNKSNTEAVIKLIGDIQQELARQIGKNHEVVTHYMTKHGYIPLWVLVNVLTFGKISNFYLNMKLADRQKVSKFFGTDIKELHKFMNMLSMARNKCAHDERFYDMKFKQSLHIKGIKNFKLLGILPNKDGSYIKGTNDIYAIAIIFALLLSKKELKEFITLMKKLFLKLDRQLHTISVEEVKNRMGYCDTWQNLIKLKA